jgi:hypothetical protein
LAGLWGLGMWLRMDDGRKFRWVRAGFVSRNFGCTDREIPGVFGPNPVVRTPFPSDSAISVLNLGIGRLIAG